MDVLSDYPDGTLFRPSGSAKFNDEKTVSLVDILNGEDRTAGRQAGPDSDQELGLQRL
jgi:hypothetical protein